MSAAASGAFSDCADSIAATPNVRRSTQSPPPSADCCSCAAACFRAVNASANPAKISSSPSLWRPSTGKSAGAAAVLSDTRVAGGWAGARCGGAAVAGGGAPLPKSHSRYASGLMPKCAAAAAAAAAPRPPAASAPTSAGASGVGTAPCTAFDESVGAMRCGGCGDLVVAPVEPKPNAQSWKSAGDSARCVAGGADARAMGVLGRSTGCLSTAAAKLAPEMGGAVLWHASLGGASTLDGATVALSSAAPSVAFGVLSARPKPYAQSSHTPPGCIAREEAEVVAAVSAAGAGAAGACCCRCGCGAHMPSSSSPLSESSLPDVKPEGITTSPAPPSSERHSSG
mmetsp:Transcript_15709/g.40640  ORF Transcript_15709/g.40640 Transcript_15709/m.40640 type:complete len:341 (-) Transcript_15709:593-1615(-)